MILLEESPFCRVESEVCTPVIDGIAFLKWYGLWCRGTGGEE
jgi:hypothetical protein